jgi:hypothetical protein
MSIHIARNGMRNRFVTVGFAAVALVEFETFPAVWVVAVEVQ